MKTRRIEAPANWKDLPTHPLAMLAPYGEGIDTVKLAVSMRAHGYDPSEPIVLFDGMILDGRHRHVAAQEADVVPSFVELVEGDLLAFVSKKLHRQHLNESQRALFVAALKNAVSNPPEGTGALPNTTIEQDAELAKVSRRTMVDARKVESEASEEVKQQIVNGQATVKQAAAAVSTVFCRNCRVHGPKKKCQACVDKRKEMGVSILKPAAVSKPKKSGDVLFDFREYDRFLGPVIRGIDELKKAYPEVARSSEFTEIEHLAEEFCRTWKRLRQLATKLKE